MRDRSRRDPQRGPRWSEWMTAAQSGDVRAYEDLLRELVPALRAFVRRRLPREAGAEDVVQTVLLSVHRARHSYRSGQPFEAWLFAIARNAVSDFQRTRRRLARRERPMPEDDALPTGPPASHGERQPAGFWFSREVDHALSKLPPSQQEAVVLLHGQGFSVAEAALRTRVSPGALKARAHRAYTALRALLQETSS